MVSGPSSHERELEIFFIPITCSAPLLHAHRHGIFERNGLHVKLRPAPGWSGVKELVAYGKADIVHMLTPMAFAAHLGVDGRRADLRVLAVQNINGQSLVIARKHRGLRDIRAMKGFRFGVPYFFSMQYYLLCDLLAKHGLDPLADVEIEEVAPPRLPYYLERGRLDAAFSPEPFAQIAVQKGSGFIHTLSRDLWRGHPCCSLVARQEFLDTHPDTCSKVMASVIEAERGLHLADPSERRRMANEISEMGYWNPEDASAVEQVLTGSFTDGFGGSRTVHDRIDFIPHLWPEYGVWILSQMQRWGQLPGEVDYDAVTGKVFGTEATRIVAREHGFVEEAPHLALDIPSKSDTAFATMLRQPCCAFRSAATPKQRHELPPHTRARLAEIADKLAEVTGGRSELVLEVTSEGEIGWIEQLINETIRNMRFAREAVEEQIERRASLQELVISTQAELIRQLTAPIIPILPGVLVLPLVGQLDGPRAVRITRSLLDSVSSRDTDLLLVDITGVVSLDAEALSHLVKMMKAVTLLGARCMLIGVSPSVADALVESGVDLSETPTLRDLASGIDHAIHRATPSAKQTSRT